MTAMQLLLPLYIYWAITSDAPDWYWLLTFLFYFLYLCIGNNIGLHRLFHHRHFSVSKPMEYFIAWCSTMACLGSPLSYSTIHVIHHKIPDTEKDPHGPDRGWKSVLFYYHLTPTPDEYMYSKHLAVLLRYWWILHNYYWLIVFANAALIYLLFGWTALLFCWLIPASLTLWGVAIVLLMQHNANGPSNTRSYQWFGFGEAFHKNHHENPGLANHPDPGCIDWTYQLCKILSKSKN